MDYMLKDDLKRLGLGEKEALVYIKVLNLGTAVVGTISRQTGISRPTVYKLLENLIKKELVTKIEKDNVLSYTAENPNRFLISINEEEENLNERKEIVERIVPQLNKERNIYKDLPKVQYFEGEEGYKDLIEKVINSQEDEIYMFSNTMISTNEGENIKLYDFFEYEFEEFEKERIKNGIYMKLLTNNSEYSKTLKEEDQKELRQTKVLPESFGNIESMIITDDFYVILTDNYPVIGLYVQEEQNVSMMKNIFMYIWESIE